MRRCEPPVNMNMNMQRGKLCEECSAVQCSAVQERVLIRAEDGNDEHGGRNSIQFIQISLHAIQSTQLDAMHNIKG